ncbi:MAG: substrate-binding domain-containing protein [Muribaculum intestinale]|nr:substrate-binding domain-containing protein [Muribaculum intestinale]
MKKLSIYLFIITFLTTVLAACSDSRIYKIGVSQCSQDDWRSKMNDEINREIMLHEDAEVEIRSADDSNPKQISDIRYFADNGFDIIIVSPNEAQSLTPIIKEVYESGIPVIIFDRNIIGDSYTCVL